MLHDRGLGLLGRLVPLVFCLVVVRTPVLFVTLSSHQETASPVTLDSDSVVVAEQSPLPSVGGFFGLFVNAPRSPLSKASRKVEFVQGFG